MDPGAVDLSDTYALLMAGIFGVLLSAAVIAMTIRGRPYLYTFSVSGRRVSAHDRRNFAGLTEDHRHGKSISQDLPPSSFSTAAWPSSL